MANQSDTDFLAPLIDMLATTWPSDTPAEDRRNAARAALEALQPRDLVEAMLAARMIAAHHATMDGYRRAMQPGLSDADAIRLRGSAIAASRSFDAALRILQKGRSAGPSVQEPVAMVTPVPRPSPSPSFNRPAVAPRGPGISRPPYVDAPNAAAASDANRQPIMSGGPSSA